MLISNYPNELAVDEFNNDHDQNIMFNRRIFDFILLMKIRGLTFSYSIFLFKSTSEESGHKNKKATKTKCGSIRFSVSQSVS